ncbi:hypothetical protein B0H17DRAFT_1123935 [Mycena rosella]|uniref:Uncharacterized protein n=1 Tax=Mycena rosella TaxID=1033263 RepID=A0AAD7H2U7_MYCRO|nr:hypothetical protein B0H17DRAFT_1123935 [Mycena rosella]
MAQVEAEEQELELVMAQPLHWQLDLVAFEPVQGDYLQAETPEGPAQQYVVDQKVELVTAQVEAENQQHWQPDLVAFEPVQGDYLQAETPEGPAQQYVVAAGELIGADAVSVDCQGPYCHVRSFEMQSEHAVEY